MEIRTEKNFFPIAGNLVLTTVLLTLNYLLHSHRRSTTVSLETYPFIPFFPIAWFCFLSQIIIGIFTGFQGIR